MRPKVIFFLVLVALTFVAVVDTASGGLATLDRAIGPVVLGPERSEFGSSGPTDPRSPHATASGHLKMDAAGIDRFAIDNDFGSVAVAASEEDVIEVDYEITLYAESQELAEEFAAKCSVDLSSGGNQARAQLIQPQETPAEINGVVTKYTVKLPARLQIDVTNQFGPVTVDGVSGNVNLENGFGETKARNIGGSLVVRTRFGPGEVSQVAKDAEITAEQGNLILKGVGGNLMLRSKFVQVDASDIGGKVDLVSEHGSVKLQGVTGGLSARCDFASLRGLNIHGRVDIDTEHGAVEIEGIDSEARIETSYAPARVVLGQAAQGYTVKMRTRFGNIESNVPITVSKPAQNEEQATVVVGQGKIPVQVETEFGKITLQGK